MKRNIAAFLGACMFACAAYGCAVLDTAHFALCCGGVVKDALDHIPASVTTVKKPKPVSVDEKPAMPEEDIEYTTNSGR